MDIVAGQLLTAYKAATLGARFKNEAAVAALKISHNLSEYQKVSAALGSPIPAWFVGCLHYRENASLSLKCFLGNGQMIIGTGRRSTIVPVGLGPFATFHEGAVVACRRQGFASVRVWDIGTCLEEAERWNGLGYRRLGVVNPYLFSGTSLYKSGKYVADGHYVASAVDAQPGIACIMKALEASGVIAKATLPRATLEKDPYELAIMEAQTPGLAR